MPEKRKVGRPKGSASFGRVQRIKEQLTRDARKAAKHLIRASEVAAEKGNADPAIYILNHVEAINEQGQTIRPVAPSVDRQQLDQKEGGVQILIGGGWSGQQPVIAVREVKALPEPAKSDE